MNFYLVLIEDHGHKSVQCFIEAGDGKGTVEASDYLVECLKDPNVKGTVRLLNWDNIPVQAEAFAIGVQ